MQATNVSGTHDNGSIISPRAPSGIVCLAVALVIGSVAGLLVLFQMARPFVQRSTSGFRLASISPDLAQSLGVLGGQVERLMNILGPYFVAVIVICVFLLWHNQLWHRPTYWIAVAFFGLTACYFCLMYSQVTSHSLLLEARQLGTDTMIVVRTLNKVYLALSAINMLILAFLLTYCRAYADNRPVQ